MKKQSKKIQWRLIFSKKQIFTVPNILSFLRLAMIPVIIWLYCFQDAPYWALFVIFLSGVTDVVDGFIARKFNLVTDFGKALDPIADKLTQIAVLICLLTRFPLMALPLILMFIKEAVAFILRLIVFKQTQEVHSAEWHGKLTTVLLYLLMGVHIVWASIPSPVSITSILIVFGVMFLSFVLYTVSNALILKRSKQQPEQMADEISTIEKAENDYSL